MLIFNGVTHVCHFLFVGKVGVLLRLHLVTPSSLVCLPFTCLNSIKTSGLHLPVTETLRMLTFKYKRMIKGEINELKNIKKSISWMKLIILYICCTNPVAVRTFCQTTFHVLYKKIYILFLYMLTHSAKATFQGAMTKCDN